MTVLIVRIPTASWFTASLEQQRIRRCPRCGADLIRSKFRAIPACWVCLLALDRVNR